MKIQGRYNIHINIPTMFHMYELELNEHNIVTDKGVKFILEKILDKNDEYIEKIIIGYGTSEPSPSDSFDIIQEPYMQEFDNINITQNELHLELLVGGDILNETSEIGLITNKQMLVTRDVHDTYDIPTNASVKIEYVLSLTNVGEEND